MVDFGLLWWGKWTIKCNFRLNRCFICHTILILVFFSQAQAEELCAAHLSVCVLATEQTEREREKTKTWEVYE
jgi:hypothetical protein